MSTKAVIHGIRWTLITTILRRLISFVLFIFVAKWLTQADFGIYRSFSLIIVLLVYFTTLGLDYHLLTSRKHKLLNLFANLQTGVLISIFITIFLALTGSTIGKFYHSAELGRIVSWSGGIILLESLRRIVRVQAQKQLMFKELALAETLNVFVYSALCLVLLYFWRHAWLFITLFYLGNLSELLYLAYKLKTSPKHLLHRIFSLHWLKRSLRIISLNRWFLSNVTITNIVQIYSSNAPVLFLGAMVQPELMGIYFFATQLIAIPVGMFTTSLSQVFFPVLAKGEAASNLQGIRRYTSLVLKLGIPALFAYAIILQYVIPILWGNKWIDSLPIILSLVLFYATSLLHHPISGIPYICRKPLWELGWNIITMALRLLALALGLQISYAFAVLMFCVVSAVMHLVFYFMSLKMLGARLTEVFGYFAVHLPALTIFIFSGLFLLRQSMVFPLVAFSAYTLYIIVAEWDTVRELFLLFRAKQ